MLTFVVRRLGLLVVVLFGLSLLLFAWIRALPGDPARALLGEKATPAGIASVNARYGFDQPVWQQYLTYLGQIVRGDFGSSINTGEPVVSTFAERFPATIELALAALVLAIALGIPLGYLAARRRGGWLDNAVVGGSLLGVVVPVFFLAVILKYLLAIELGWFPTTGRQDARIDATHVTNFYVLDGLLTREWDASWDALVHLVLPALALGSIPLAIIVRITRASVLDVLGDDHVRTARAKGLPQGIISRRHVLRNALLPVSTTLGLQAGALLSGAVLTETVFAINGIGSYLFDAVTQLDYPVLQGFILFIAVMYALVNLVVDVSYGFIDPRVRVS
ncbi:peptide/nickel transport system permease protein [Kineococcus radiotolerans]|uniref:Binding-protein-dependent transport systems inner membrane component n=2 Tax=Kineococcus radiotolerans TaxID=131568 RepID=A6WCC2_KINRD|nr:ABC transporter permease [Kineococcus radiotolerans]ABS04461.1 binding-protein-dependent transport systems inner membrane component [Kineococcus radiotolerans SRS30216 = ATCC BAA-149]MBB2902864.1 peptide/nickel transport system permease protein [Kineococcus radiotolerans]